VSLLSVLLISGCSKKSEEGEMTINIDKDFEYVSKGHPLGLSVGQTQAVGLKPSPYETLQKEPVYGADEVVYGYIPLGNSGDTKISFAIDSSEDGKAVAYVDTNNNEDLTDDGPPHPNQGTGKFAALISLNVEVISASGKKIMRPYQFWFWIDASDSPRFYTRCHYRGQVSIGAEEYLAIACESKNHDALYKESGLWIDLNENGKLDDSQEHFSDGATISVGGAQRVLHLSYP